MKRLHYVITIFLLVVLVACNLPRGQATLSPEAAFTAAALTVQAELTRVAPQTSPTLYPTSTLENTPSNSPGNTPTPTSTTSTSCNMYNYLGDVTYPDYYVLTPGQTFAKTWRLRNAGTCTWTSGYKLAFDSGDSMGVPAGYEQSLTSGTVAPGQTIDVSVNLTAPMTAGTYQGNWKLREPGGQYFFSSTGKKFWVLIAVSTTTGHTVTLTSVAAEDGQARSDGTTNPSTNVGDYLGGVSVQAFLSFDISGIPSNATITEVKVNLASGGYDYVHNPWILGCLNLYPQDYGALDGSDYYSGAVGSPYVNWCTDGDLNTAQIDYDLLALLQSRLGTTRLQVRLQFQNATNGDAVDDAIRLIAPKLIVTYTTP